MERIRRAAFGRLPDGRDVEAITLENTSGLSATVITYGARLQAMRVPDRGGVLADITLGFPDIGGYLSDTAYFGATVGRVANRIAAGRFTLDGQLVEVPANNGANALHGGPEGFDRRLWGVIAVEAEPVARVTLGLVSPDGDQGFPGALTATASFSLDDEDVLTVDYMASCDRPTVVNLSNHAYWNLGGEGSGTALDHLLTIPADTFLPTDDGAIPTGAFRPVDGSAFDFRSPRRIGARIRDAADEQLLIGRGYDHNFVVDRAATESPRLVARLEDDRSGRVLEVLSTQPGVQFYSGNFLDGTVAGKSGRRYRQGDAVALEPQMFPDTPNRPEFGSIRLEPGMRYRNLILFRFSTSPGR